VALNKIKEKKLKLTNNPGYCQIQTSQLLAKFYWACVSALLQGLMDGMKNYDFIDDLHIFTQTRKDRHCQKRLPKSGFIFHVEEEIQAYLVNVGLKLIQIC